MLININLEVFFKDYGEYIVGIPATMFGLWFAYFVYRRQKNTKSLTYEVLSNYRLITVDSKYRSQFKILFKNDEVENVNLFVIRIKNTGNIPIEKKDFDKPIKIEFMGDSRIIFGEILEQSPNNLGIEFIVGKNLLEVSPCLINQDDSFSIQILVNSNKVEFLIDGRISGIKKIIEIQNDKGNKEMLLIGFYCFTLFSFYAFILFRYFSSEIGLGFWRSLLMAFNFAFALIGTLFFLFKRVHIFFLEKRTQ